MCTEVFKQLPWEMLLWHLLQLWPSSVCHEAFSPEQPMCQNDQHIFYILKPKFHYADFYLSFADTHHESRKQQKL